MASFVDRMLGAARLDPKIYEEVEADATALGQAMAVVALAAVGAGIGGVRAGGGGIVAGVVAALVGWLVWAVITWFVGTKMMPEAQTRADLGQMLRVLGFAASPGLLMLLRILPLIGGLVALLIWIWQLAAMVVAVRQALDYTSTGRAVAVCVVGWIVYIAISFTLALAFGGLSFVAGG
jgi:hypothetical protein